MTAIRSQWSPELRAKLAKLIRMLASPREGEVLAAARAIQRMLATEGADLHDLADVLTGARPERRSTPSKPSAAAGSSETKTLDEFLKSFWVSNCRRCLEHAADLTEAELTFVQHFAQNLADNRPYKGRDLARLMRICSRLGI